ncbi:MAG TPA: SDR family NAD(P)-dependent oxidoreductase [Patescibacteria group bacterium]|nr:SDR family NAD(P)-dependent oxidoreductase [Patescibacteria group bacterium]
MKATRNPTPSVAAVVDALLELSIVGSFSRLGPAVRRRLEGWAAPPADILVGRTILITGPTSGLGRVTARALADLGARIVLVGRNPDKLHDVAVELTTRTGRDRFPTVTADLGSIASVRTAVAGILATERRLDVLIDNAGAMFPARTAGPDGMEATFGLMVGGPFALVAGLVPLLRASRGRVIAVTSGGLYAQPLDLDDLQSSRRPWSGPKAYARSKRAQTALIREWAHRFAGTGLTFNAMHPGWADTPGLADSLPSFHRFLGPLLRSAEDGADTIVWLAANPESAGWTGRLFLDRRPRPFDRAPGTRLSAAQRRELWDSVVKLTGTDDPTPVK